MNLMETEREQMGLTSEAALARQIGLSRETLVVFRQQHLQAGVDFQRIKREVRLAQGAVERVLAHFACPDSQNGKNGHGEAGNAIAEPVLLVVLRNARNEKILFARKKEGDGCELRVRVRSNANFLPGMEIRAMPHPEYDDFYDLVGRCPRQRGRW